MTINDSVIEFGLVCPGWARKVWNSDACTVEPTTEGVFVVLDHTIQTVVYRGKTQEECEEWLKNPFTMEANLTGYPLDSCSMVICPYCGESYLLEDGHPFGTLCSKFGMAEETSNQPVQEIRPSFIECTKHPGSWYWWEDFCPKCAEEADAEEAKI